jgi:leucyl-tRNA synthetase
VIELVNDIYTAKSDPNQAADVRFATETAVSLIQPYVPHIAEELWQRLGHERLWETDWPQADPAFLERDTFQLVVQVNGRVRGRVEVPADLAEDELVARAKELPRVAAHLDGKNVKKAIVVPGRLVNLVV